MMKRTTTIEEEVEEPERVTGEHSGQSDFGLTRQREAPGEGVSSWRERDG